MVNEDVSVHTANVWARESEISGNHIRQPLVPAGELTIERNTNTGALCVRGRGGQWPALQGSQARPTGDLTAVVSSLIAQGHRVTWSGSHAPSSPEDVAASYAGALTFNRPTGSDGLRPPQIGAIHSVMGYWTTTLSDP